MQTIYEYAHEGFIVSTDKSRLQFDVICRYLSEQSYWAEGRTPEVVRTSIDNSLCYGAYIGSDQVGFARVVTDYATFAWICDVFVLESARGRGIGKRMVEDIVFHPQLINLRRMMLATRDAHMLYRNYAGFQPLAAPDNILERRRS